jgi:glutathione S-transferase
MQHLLELYQFEECPYCKMVRAKLTDLGIDYLIRNVPRDKTKREKVIALSGQPSVPVLVDKNTNPHTVLADENDIIAYLERRFYT